MAIIEFAHITLRPGLTASDPLLRQNLRDVKRAIEDYSKLQTLFYVQLDDPSIMYVVGAWETREKHMNGFDGSKEQASILGLIKDQMGIDWMHYLDVEQSSIPLDAEVVAVVKMNFARGEVERDEVLKEVEGVSTPGTLGSTCGWNLHKDDQEDDVLVQFTGWKTIDEAEAFTKKVVLNETIRRQSKSVVFMYMTKADLN